MDVVSNIRAANAGREQERLQIKYRKMNGDPFVFLRGTCHLFYNRLPSHSIFQTAPAVWSCGDLHLENYGSYKGNNRLIYFDINDFEEAVLAPATWDVVRMLTSIRLGAADKGLNRSVATRLCTAFVDTYASALAQGKALWVERDTANGLVKDLFEALRKRTRAKFLDDRTKSRGGLRTLRIDGQEVKWDKKRMLAVSDDDRSAVELALGAFAKTQESPGFYRVRGVARRIAGTGSLGLGRFAVLVEGKGSPNGNYLLDLKQSTRSSLVDRLEIAQPQWETEAERIVELQRRMQAVSAAFLHPLVVGGHPYVLRELQPTDDSAKLDASKRPAKIEQLLETMGRIVAWSQLRSAGRAGSVMADRLIDFGGDADWRPTLIALSEDCAAQVRKDSAVFDRAYKQEAFEAA
ncbi:MAG: DUF2252 domain-containing protein [Variovorax sp.]|nr:MAG: DUF2252 domain-containing protein [Variovorax sp.]